MGIQEEIASLIEDALGLEQGEITVDSSNKNIAEWDSLGHFAILSSLDKKFDDITIREPRLVEASTVSQIVDLVKNAQK